MKQRWRMIERYFPWVLLLLGVDCFCAIILWISDIQAFQTLIGLVVLTSILLFSVLLFVLSKQETTRRELFRDFVSDPAICNEERLLSAISREEGESIRLLASVLREYKTESSSMADALSDTEDVLSIEDNGIGVKKYNLPYIFQKGFTGDSTDSRKMATGMGLYLTKKMADALNLRLEATSQWGKGFRMVIFFPK